MNETARFREPFSASYPYRLEQHEETRRCLDRRDDGRLARPDIDRLLSALRHVKADRVPNFDVWFNPAVISHVVGEPTTQNFWELPPREAIRFAQAAGQDAIVCSLTWSPPAGSIRTMDDARRLCPPDPLAARAKLETYLRAAEGTGVGVCARLSCPFSLAYNSTGPVPIQSFMYLLYDDPELIAYLMDLYLEVHLGIYRAIADLPYHFTYLGDDIASTQGLLVSPQTMADIWEKRTEGIVREGLIGGRPMIFHCCGKQEFLYPYLVEWGVHAVHPIQPVANDIYDVHRRWGDRLTLVGNIDVSGPLSFGGPAEVRAEVGEHIERLSQDGGYVVCSSHSIIESVIPENYEAMVTATREFGAN